MQRKVIWVVLLLVGSTTSYAQMDKYLKDSIPNAWVESELFDPTLPSEDRWWNTFNDSVLSRLIVEAVENNYDILMAADRMDQSRANMRMQQSGFYPKIGVEAAWMPQQSQTGRTQHGSAQVDLSWEVDLIGSIRNRAKSQKEMFNVSQSEYNAVLVSLCAQVASTYINLRVAQNQLYVANINLKSQEDILKIAEARYSAGLVSALDVAQAKTVYESTKAIIPAWEAQSICYSNALSVLLGKYPWQMRK
ncbi:MAG: TolC family protein, partial [Bacteroidales bacterium]